LLPIVPIESLLFDEPAPRRISVPSLELTTETRIVPIEALAPEPAVAPVAAAAPPAKGETSDLAGSFATYQRLVATLGRPPVASLEALMAGTRIEPVRRTAPVPAAVAPTSPSFPTSPVAAEESPILDITTLCYRGRAALERAAVVRDQIRMARSARAPSPEVEPLVEELLDLVELALVESV
jgi:hypothetical protein